MLYHHLLFYYLKTHGRENFIKAEKESLQQDFKNVFSCGGSAIYYPNEMEILHKNEFWMLIFSLGLLYWLFNPSVIMTLVMIIPLLLATISNK